MMPGMVHCPAQTCALNLPMWFSTDFNFVGSCGGGGLHVPYFSSTGASISVSSKRKYGFLEISSRVPGLVAMASVLANSSEEASSRSDSVHWLSPPRSSLAPLRTLHFLSQIVCEPSIVTVIVENGPATITARDDMVDRTGELQAHQTEGEHANVKHSTPLKTDDQVRARRGPRHEVRRAHFLRRHRQLTHHSRFAACNLSSWSLKWRFKCSVFSYSV